MHFLGPKPQQQITLSAFGMPPQARTIPPEIVVTPYDVHFLIKVPIIPLTQANASAFLPSAAREAPSAPAMAALLVETIHRYQGRFVTLRELFNHAAQIVGLGIVAEEMVFAPPPDLIRAIGERYSLAIFLRGTEALIERQLGGSARVTLAHDATSVTIQPVELVANSFELRLEGPIATSVVERSWLLRRPSIRPAMVANQVAEALGNLHNIRQYLEEASRGLFRGYERSHDAHRGAS